MKNSIDKIEKYKRLEQAEVEYQSKIEEILHTNSNKEKNKTTTKTSITTTFMNSCDMIKRPNLKIHGVEEGTGIQGLKKHE
jgi:uncharacterized pyridoxal phosphate-containing UPF0001 family protein